MCYIIITGGSTLWFTLSLVADMLVVTAIMTPRWLVGPTAYIAAYNTPQHMKSLLLNIENSDHRQQMQRKLQQIQQQQQSHDQQHVINRQVRGRRESDHYDDEMDDVYEVDDDYIEATNAPITTTTRTLLSLPDYRRYPSVGIHSRCKAMQGGDGGFHCGRFDLDGFATDAHIYPDAWKATMFFISLGCVLLSTSVLGTLLSCCRQALCGKSLHNLIACWQVAAGLSVMMSLFLHPLGWTSERVRVLCGPDVEPFYVGDCSMGMSFYCAASGALLCFVCAGISAKAEASNLRSRVKRRVEEGERLVCIP